MTAAEYIIKYKLSSNMVGIIFSLHRKGDTKMRDLAAGIETTDAAITGLVDQLEGQGILERRNSLNDRRIKLIRLTDLGNTIASKL